MPPKQSASELQGSSGAGNSAQTALRTTSVGACERCKELNYNCDGVRPSCRMCRAAGFTCSYEDDLSVEELEERVRDAGTVLEDYEYLRERIQSGSDDEARDIFARLRSSATVQEVIAHLRNQGTPTNGSTSTPGSNRPESTQPENNNSNHENGNNRSHRSAS